LERICAASAVTTRRKLFFVEVETERVRAGLGGSFGIGQMVMPQILMRIMASALRRYCAEQIASAAAGSARA